MDTDGISNFKSNYLGFVVVKDIKDIHGNQLIGRTLLKTYDSIDGSKRRHFVTRKYHASLYGMNLSVDSLPFQVQDKGVSACATIALWSAIHPLYDTFETPRHSPSEITEISFSSKSSSLPSLARIFPSDGLTLWQMIDYTRSINLDIESVDIEKQIDKYPIIVKDVVKAYVTAKLPLIAVLELIKRSKSVYHASVVNGYRCNESGDLTALYVHDDQIGPFSKVTSDTESDTDNNFKLWRNEWLDRGYTGVILKKFLIPIYPKIRLPFSRIYPYYDDVRREVEGTELNVELFLTQVKDYKAEIIEKPIQNKEKHLMAYLPRFMWIIRIFDEMGIQADHIYDGTSVYPRRLDPVLYDSD